MDSEYIPVPVTAARAAALNFKKDIVVIFSYDRKHQTGHTTTYGVTRADKEGAARLGDEVSKLIFGPKGQTFEDFRLDQHTPGPLKASKGWDGDPDRWVVVTDGERRYLVATIENGQPGDTCETEGYTAKLFAAAPELLESLKGVLSSLDDAHQDALERSKTSDRWIPVAEAFKAQCDGIRAAISKAEGGTAE
jgi:hypothetical protein